MSSFGGRRYGRPRSWQKTGGVRSVRDGSYEGDQIERDYTFPTEGFCHDCEAFVDEGAGKLHRTRCKVEPSERKQTG